MPHEQRRLQPEDVRIMLADLHGLAQMDETWRHVLIERIENERARWADV